MLNKLMALIWNVLTGKVTFKQAYYIIYMRLRNTQKDLGDEFDWSVYPYHYKEELKSVARVATLIIKEGDFVYSNKALLQANREALPLVVNHHLLYETILGLDPESVLEFGCGGGDHLRNIHALNPKINLFGIDRSEVQLQTLRERHPGLPATLTVIDATESGAQLPPADVVYTQAVLMHISEKDDRLRNGIANIFRAATKQVVLVENWPQHDFFTFIHDAISANADWKDAKLYYMKCSVDEKIRCLIVSKEPLAYPELEDYRPLLQGEAIWSNLGYE